MKTVCVSIFLVVCCAGVSFARVVREESRDSVCAFYLDAPVSLSDNVSAKTALIDVLKNMTDDALVRFNNGTNDVAVFLESRQDALALCRALVTDVVFPESVFGSPVRVLQHTAKASLNKKCTYGGSCKWWWGSCQLYRTCGKGYVSGGVNGAGDLYGNACTSSCKSKCYSYCQCPNDTSCYGK